MISVIVPIYNVEKYLAECIESILQQSYNDLEIILVDDGSPDNCGAICDEYQSKDSRIIVIHKENGGISDARNAGMDIATGEYIAFVDSDDFIHPRMYEYLLKALTDYNSDFSACDYFEFSKYNPIPTSNISSEGTYIFDKLGDKNCHLNNLLQGSHKNYVWNKLYKKSYLENIRFKKGMKYEDVIFSADISPYINKYVIIKDKLYYYRRNTSSTTLSNPYVFFEHISALEYNIDFFMQNRDVKFAQKYAEFAMSYILTRQIEKHVQGIYDKYADNESQKAFNRIYDKYGSSQKSHFLARRFPFLYNVIKKQKVKKYMSNT